MSKPSQAAPVAKDAGTWTPVKDKPSGLTYYWNQETGQLPALPSELWPCVHLLEAPIGEQALDRTANVR